MATDSETLLVNLSADMKAFQSAMLRAAGEADRAASRIERRFQQANQRTVADFERFRNQVAGVIAAIGVGVVVRDVVALGDKWTRVGNALSVAGVESSQLAATQQVVADIASRTRSELEATADLFARLLRASEDLGASMGDVAAATELVSKALSGASESERQGAIRQLGQGLASGRLQGDELRSILENSRPIAEAIAAEFETTIGNLRRLGAEGRLESRRVFQAILNAGPEIEAAYARTTFTVADAFNKLETEAARFIGTNEQTSGSIRGLARLVDFVANNFDLLADAVVLTATVLGGAFAGVAAARAVTALGAIAAGGTAARNALLFLGGPLGIALGAAATGFALLATQTDVFSTAAERAARTSDAMYQALQVIAGFQATTEQAADLSIEKLEGLEQAFERLDAAADGAARETQELSTVSAQAASQLDNLSDNSKDATSSLTAQERATRALAIAERERALATLVNAQSQLRADLRGEERARDLRDLQRFLNSPSGNPERERRNLQRLDREDEAGLRRREQILADELFIREAIADLRAGRVQVATPDDPAGGEAVVNNNPLGQGSQRDRAAALADMQRAAELNRARLQNDFDRVQQLEDAAEVEKRTQGYIEAGLALTAARVQAEAEVRLERQLSNEEATRSLRIMELQDAQEIARIRSQTGIVDKIQDELAIRQRTVELMQRFAYSQIEATQMAEEYVATLREARELERAYNLELRGLETALEIARREGDERAERAIARRLELEARIRDLRQQGLDEDAALSRATAELDSLEEADARGRFREWFRDGFQAAIDGDFGDYFQQWMAERAGRALDEALNSLADFAFDAFGDSVRGLLEGSLSNLGGQVANVLGGGATDALVKLGGAATEAGEVIKGQLVAAAVTAATQEAASTATKASATAASVTAEALLAKSALGAAAALNFAANAARAFAAAAGGGGGKDKLLSSLFSSVIGSFGGGFGGFRANGGPVSPGSWYMVGERGPEPFIPSVPGVIMPNKALGGGGVAVNYVDRTLINITGASTAEVAQLRGVVSEIIRTQKQNTITIIREAARRPRGLGA